MTCWSFLWPFFFLRYLRLASTTPTPRTGAGNGVGVMSSTAVGTRVEASREVVEGLAARLVCTCEGKERV
jgi:hypothetical protein